MNIEMNDPRLSNFLSNIGLITTNGKNGPNIMASAWTYHVSYKPFRVANFLVPGSLTYENIIENNEYGVNIVSYNQNELSSLAGGMSGREINKISLLKDLDFEFYPAEYIDVVMVKDTSINLEIEVNKILNVGSHDMILGDVLSIKSTDKEPLIYHMGKYWKKGQDVKKPEESKLDKIEELKRKHTI